MPVLLLKDICCGTGACAEVCPVDVFELRPGTRNVVIANPSNCFDCSACIYACPTSALVVC